MGMYTGLDLEVTLSEQFLEENRHILEWMLKSKDGDQSPHLPGHPLFKCFRSDFMFRGSSAYLDDEFEPNSSLEGNILKVRFNIKNYDSEIQKFLDWISRHIASFKYGKYQYEEAEKPSKITFHEAKQEFLIDGKEIEQWQLRAPKENES